MSRRYRFEGTIGTVIGDSEPWWPDAPRPPARAPNIVMVVLDDVGFAQLGCYGGDIDTPVIDRLAGRGARYRNFHVTALCSPTRACLLTGRNHHAVGMGLVANMDNGFPGYRGYVSHEATTIAELLGDVGYATYCVGKWHLVPPREMGPLGPFDHWPLGRGFDHYYGFLHGMTDQWTPNLWEDNHSVAQPEGGAITFPRTWSTTPSSICGTTSRPIQTAPSSCTSLSVRDTIPTRSLVPTSNATPVALTTAGTRRVIGSWLDRLQPASYRVIPVCLHPILTLHPGIRSAAMNGVCSRAWRKSLRDFSHMPTSSWGAWSISSKRTVSSTTQC